MTGRHILFAVHGYKPAYRVGGPIHSVAALAESLVACGNRVTVFTSNANVDEDLDVEVNCPIDVDGVTVWYFRREEPLRRWFGWLPYLSQSMGFLYAPEMRAELDRIMPTVDIVHTHMPFVYPTLAAGRAALRHGKPLVYHQRGVYDPERLRFRGMKKRAFIALIEKPLMRRASALVALTVAEVTSYRALGIQTDVRVIPNGIHVARFRPEPVTTVWRTRGVPDDATMILFLGRVHPIKGADRLLEAFLSVSEEFPNAYLVIAGPDEWGLQAKFLQRAERAGIAHRVLFPGMVQGEEKLELLARADLFALPSDAEGFSMAVLEALASATAVLLSPGCYFPEVEEAGAGRIAPRDAGSTAAALRELLVDRNGLRTMGRRGRALVEAQYTWKRVTEMIIEAYDTVSTVGAGREG